MILDNKNCKNLRNLALWLYGGANEPSNLIVNGDKRTVYKKVECYSMSTSPARSRLALSG